MLTGLDFPIEIASVPPDLPQPTARGVLWQAGPGQFLLAVPEVARYLVSDGRQITVDPAPGASEADVARFALMTPLAALWYQRGQVALHAAAGLLPPGGGATLLAGDSGAGKSTLLAALLQQGWTMLADDLAVVKVGGDGAPVVRPTPAPLRLWPDAQQELGALPEEAGISGVSPQSRPVSAIYWLTVHNGRRLETETLTGAARFRALGSLLYNSRIADALLGKAAYLSCASRLAQTVPVIRLRRPRGRWSVPELAEIIGPTTTEQRTNDP